MSDQTDNRTPEEIERDIARTRADFSSTVEASQAKLDPSELAGQAVDYVMTTPPVAYSVNVANTIWSNPIPIAMFGVGLAWFMSVNRQAKEHARYPRRQRAVHRTGYHPDAEIGYESAHATAHHSTNSGDGMLHRASSKVNETGRDLKDKASEMGERLSSSASEVTERARHISQNAASRLQETAEEAQAHLEQMGQRSQEQYYRAKDSFSQLLEEQPLVVGALGLAMGAALGAILPTTRRENELLGQTRDELLERATETAREQTEHVKQSAQRVMEVAKEEVGRVTEVVKEEAGHVAETVKEEAKQAKDKM